MSYVLSYFYVFVYDALMVKKYIFKLNVIQHCDQVRNDLKESIQCLD